MIRVTSTAGPTLARQLDRITGPGLEQLLDEQGALIRIDAVATWPSTTRDVHIYARDRSVTKWRIASSPRQRVIHNEAEYSGYVDDGYTRWKGAQSAKPWRARGSTAYTVQTLQGAAERAARAMADRLRGDG